MNVDFAFDSHTHTRIPIQWLSFECVLRMMSEHIKMVIH